MNGLLEHQLHCIDSAEAHWSTGTILTVFFAASMVTALFFGLGYSFGRGGSARPEIADATATAATPTPPAVHPTASPDRSSAIAASGHLQPVTVRTVTSGAAIAANHLPSVPERAAPSSTHPVSSTVVAKAHAHAASAAVSGYMVQVGAIGDRKDAQLLVAQLRRHGLRAGIYPGKNDKFLHVQLGPFATRDQAQTMRHKVLQNGYRALIKARS